MEETTHDKLLEDAVRTARAALVFLRPYICRAILAFILVESERVPTMAVDQFWRLYYNPKWLRQRFPTERELLNALVAIVYHETCHRLRRHNEAAIRMGVSLEYGSVAHVAQECEINDDHADEVAADKAAHVLNGIPPLPDGCIYPSTYGLPEHLTWEQYYELLLPMATKISLKSCPLPDCGSGAHGLGRPWELGAPQESGVEGIEEADARDIERAVARDIAEHQLSRGRVPANWVSWSKDILRVKPVRWEHELACGLRWSISSASGNVYHSYHRPSRRQQAVPNVVFPSMRRPLPRVVIVGDTSGSMEAVLRALPMLRSVITDICRSMGAEVIFLATDAVVHGGAQRIMDGRRAELIGGGGTDMRAGIEAACLLHPRPSVIVVITDCETAWPSKPPPIPVVIAAVTAGEWSTPSWAKTIRIRLAEEAA